MEWEKQMEVLEAEIRTAWSKVPIPVPQLVFPARGDFDVAAWRFYFEGLEEWLGGRGFDDLDRPGRDYFDVEQPMFYLTPQGCSYYLGGYLLQMARVLNEDREDVFSWGLGGIHLIGYFGDERLPEHSKLLNHDQKMALVKTIGLVLRPAGKQGLGIDGKMSAKIGHNLQKILSGL